jgi:hypothetical protein
VLGATVNRHLPGPAFLGALGGAPAAAFND